MHKNAHVGTIDLLCLPQLLGLGGQLTLKDFQLLLKLLVLGSRRKREREGGRQGGREVILICPSFHEAGIISCHSQLLSALPAAALGWPSPLSAA